MKLSPVKKNVRLFLILAISLLSVLFFLGGPGFYAQRSFKAVWNLGHLVYFALLPLVILSDSQKKEFRPLMQAIIVMGITLILGTLVELLQYGIHRTPDLGDLFRDMIGAFIAMFFLLPLRFSIPGKTLLAIKVSIVVLVAAQFYPITVALVDEHDARRDFPILADFQTPFQIHRWLNSAKISISNAVGPPGNRTMRVDLSTDRYSGVRMKYFPGNWEGYQWFQVRIFNPSRAPLRLICRIYDTAHTKGDHPFKFNDRFNSVHTFSEGWNTITINLEEVRNAPESRRMQMDKIQDIGLFASNLSRPRVLYIDDLKLF